MSTVTRPRPAPDYSAALQEAMQIRQDVTDVRTCYSQEETALLLGVHRHSVRNWELGTQVPMVPEVRAVLRDLAERVRLWRSQSSAS